MTSFFVDFKFKYSTYKLRYKVVRLLCIQYIIRK